MTLDIHAKRKLEKQERGQLYPLLLIIHVLLTLAALYFVGKYWLSSGVDLISHILADRATVAANLSITVDDVPLRNIVDAIGLVGISFGLGLVIWYGYTLFRVWTWYLSAYRNWLTVGFGFLIWSIIQLISRGDFYSLFILFLCIANVVAILLIAHQKFYPEYKREHFLTPDGISMLSRDLRAIRVVSQIIFAFFVFFLLSVFWSNIYSSLEANRNLPNFEFLFLPSNFLISPAPAWYTSSHKFGHAFVVGVLNTLQVVSVGLVLATILGVLMGIFLLSNNWLIRTITRTFVEILRNTPILVQLIFWYFVVWLIILPTFAPKFAIVEDITAIPQESIMVVKLRFFPYLFALMGISYYAWRYVAPPRLAGGAFTAVLILEFVFFLLGDSYAIIIGLAVLGAVLIALSLREDIIPSVWTGFARGIGIMAIVQFVGQLMLEGFAAANIIENSRVVWGEVDPFFYLGPNVVAFPKFIPTVNFGIFGLSVLLGLVIAVALFIYWGRVIDRTGRDIPRIFYGILIIVAFGLVGWNFAVRPISDDTRITIGEGDDAQTVTLAQVREESLLDEEELLRFESNPISVDLPTLNRFGTRVQRGLSIAPRYMALLLGLVIYTAAFIGEIVRAGIQSVPYGQIEAARAVGLSGAQTMRMIVLPQALRVIIPPLGNQYLNLSKNSSLAIAIGFADTYQIGNTIMNQSGQSVTGFAIILMIYLTLSLIISLFMNFVNSRFQLVTR